MSDVANHPLVYIPGSLDIQREGNDRFVMRGNYMIGHTHRADHMQLIYEALEIAAHSDDKYAPVFAAMLTEYMDLTKDWDG